MGTIFFAILQKILQKENQNILISKRAERERERERERGVLINNWINF